jgi:threonine/homoserine/homoserine lactone efflux protein
MDLMLLLRGVVIGFSIAAPIGPIGVLCIRRTLAEGRLSGIASGLGAATADAVYGCVAVLGLTFISSILIDQEVWLRAIGGLFLCYLGIETFSAKPAQATAPCEMEGLTYAYASTFFLTLVNPMTLLTFTAVIAGLGLTITAEGSEIVMTWVLGVFAGSSLWWLILSGGIGVFREKFDPPKLQWINRFSGAIITGFGLAALLSLV